MEIKKIGKYLKLYKTLFKYSLIQSTTYRVSFLIELFVELGYQAIFIIFFNVIFANIKEIAGWSYYEILFLAGLNIVTSELIYGMFLIFNLSRLPTNIKNGDIDTTLLKPINSLFNLSMSKPYFTSLLAIIPGFYLMWHSLNQLGRPILVGSILLAIVLLICGLAIAYSILVIISSLSFIFINTTSLPRIGERIVVDYKSQPHSVYQGILKLVFFFVFPVVFIASVPSSIILKGVNLWYVVEAISLAAVFLLLAITIWNKMISYYSSASS